MRPIGRKLHISLSLCLLFLSVLAAVEDDPRHNPWRTDTDKALMELRGKSKIVLLSADWCHWCKQLQEDSKDNNETKKILQHLHGIVVDTDTYPSLMPYYGLQGLPSLVLINDKERVVTIHTGYLPPDRLTTLLTKWQTLKAEPGVIASGLYPEMEYDKIKETKGIKGVIEQVGKGTSSQRIYLRERLAKEKDVETLLWPLLTHSTLATRVDVSKILASRYGAYDAYDAFAAPEKRSLGARQWQVHVQTQSKDVANQANK